ncbi:MAG: hypothetical protein IKC71_04795 [Clostridia bacterium]|nr:hypothetical protein [Clostridia bacterium]
MGATEILVIIGCVLVVGGVIVSAIIKKIKGVPSCDCCSSDCANCKKAKKKK